MALRHRRHPSKVGITMSDKNFTRSYRRSIVAVVACLLLFSGCKKEAPTATEPSTPPPSGTGLALHGLVIKADVPGARYDPLPGATVWLDSATATARSCVSDSLGGFTFTKVTEGTHTLRVSHASGLGLDTTVVVSDTSWLFYLFASPLWTLPRVTLAGVVQTVDQSSRTRTPLPGARVTLDTGTVNAQSRMTDSAGGFSFVRVIEGSHRLIVSEKTVATLDTQVVVSAASGVLALAVQLLPRIEVFPLAVGARWVYDYQHKATGNGYISPNNRWEKGAVTFSVLAVHDEGLKRRWTVREDDDLIQFDTTYNVPGIGVDVKPEIAISQVLTFTMLESISGLHQITVDSCSMLWRTPSPFDHDYNTYGGGAFVLNRYSRGVNDSLVYYSQLTLPTYSLDSRALARGVGLTRFFVQYVYGVNSRTQDFWWGTLRSYTPGQASSSTVMVKRPWP
jgi:hypothetical protein